MYSEKLISEFIHFLKLAIANPTSLALLLLGGVAVWGLMPLQQMPAQVMQLNNNLKEMGLNVKQNTQGLHYVEQLVAKEIEARKKRDAELWQRDYVNGVPLK